MNKQSDKPALQYNKNQNKYSNNGEVKMNKWTKLSIDFANQYDYLDQLFKVYPTIPEGIRDINQKLWNNVEKSFEAQNNEVLVKERTVM